MTGSKKENLKDQVFNRLTVLELDVEKTVRGKTYWFCLCECGNKTSILAYCLKNNNTKSCGCINTKHNMYSIKEYNVWQTMKARCTNPNNRGYLNYGGRGITVCEEWLNSFQAFFDDMGPCPKGHSIERIDNSEGYNAKNCKWASRLEQANNKRSNVLLEFNGKTLSMAQWSKEVNINAGTIWARLQKGWSVSKALTTLPNKSKKQ